MDHQPESETPLQPMINSHQNDMNKFVQNISHDDPSDGDSSGDNLEDTPNVRKHRKYQATCARVGIAVPIVFSSVAMLLAGLAIAFYSKTANELRTARENRGMVCLPCEEAKIQLESWIERAGECCVRLEDVLEMMNKIAVQKSEERIKQSEELFKAQFSSDGSSSLVKRVSAHLILANSHMTSKRDLITWQPEPDVFAYSHIEGLELSPNGNRIKVLQTGYYFLYSQLTYYQSTPVRDMAATIKHEIVAYKQQNIKNSLLVVTNMKWKGAVERTYTQQTTQVSGVILLESGMEVAVESNQAQYIRTQNPSWSYFGLHKL